MGALERQEQICESCGSAQPSSASSGDAYAVRSDAFGSVSHGSASYNSGNAASHGSASYNSGSQGSSSYNSGSHGSASYNSGSASYNSGSASYNSGSHSSASHNSGSYKMKSTDGSVRMPSLQEDLNMVHDSYNQGNMNHGQQMNNSQEQWNTHGEYQYNTDQY